MYTLVVEIQLFVLCNIADVTTGYDAATFLLSQQPSWEPLTNLPMTLTISPDLAQETR